MGRTMNWDLVLIAFLAAIPPTIAALAALMAARKSAKQTQDTNIKTIELVAKAEETTQKTDNLVKKTEEIHTLTNGNLGEVRKELDKANKKIMALHKTMSKLIKDREVKEAQAVGEGNKSVVDGVKEVITEGVKEAKEVVREVVKDAVREVKEGNA